jgi:nicotinate-nucleotide adenylyltransferase
VRIAVLGGTFDPIHNGHVAAARSVCSTFHTDEVHFVPAYSAPHKQGQESSSAFHRFAMVALGIAPFAEFRASNIEVDALEKRYTVDTLQQMRSLYPSAELLFILGTDMYQEFETWKDYRTVMKLAHLAVVHRPGFSFREDLAPYHKLQKGEDVTLPASATVFYLPFVEQPISSTAVRAACRRGEDVSASVPSAVLAYINKHKLYSKAWGDPMAGPTLS